MTFRKKEPWMAPGIAVLLPTGKGTIEVVVACVGSSELMAPRVAGRGLRRAKVELTDHYGNFYTRQEMVMKVYVRPEGVGQAFPYNPWDIDRLAA